MGPPNGSPILHRTATTHTASHDRQDSDRPAPAPDPPGDGPAPAPRPLTRRAVVYVTFAIALGTGVAVASILDVLTRPFSPVWLALLALTVVAGWATLRVPAMPISFSISDTFSIVAALLVGPAAGALTAAIDGLVLSYRMTRVRRAPHRVLFNMACPAVAIWTAGQLFVALAGPPPFTAGPLGALTLIAPLVVFGCVNFFLNTGMIATAVALERGVPVLATWKEHFARLWVTHLGGVFAAMLMLVLWDMRNGLPGRATITTLEVLILIAPLPVILYVTFRHALGRAADQIAQLARMNKVYVGAIEALAQAIDAKDQVTHDHIRRVQENAVRLARALGVDDDMEIQAIKAAALLHDVGKLGVPEHILNKPGRLSGPEFEIMKRHAPIGADILAMIGFPYPVVPIVRHHHESWNGSGYPDGLSGEAIPIGARILSVVDCFDALTSDRPYRPRLDDRDALTVLADRTGTMYDPRVVDAFFALHAADTGRQFDTADTRPARPPAAVVPPPETSAAPGDADITAVYELGRALSPDAPLADLGAVLWRYVGRHVPASAFVLFVYDESCDAIVPAYESGDPALAPDARIPVGDRLSGWVAASKQPIVNSDARLDLDAAVREETLLRSALAVPIVFATRTLGVLTLYSRQPDGFTDAHLCVVQAVAYVVAIHGQSACEGVRS